PTSTLSLHDALPILGGLGGAVLLSFRTVRQRVFRQPHPGATVFRAVGNILGFVLAGAGGFSLFDVEQGWVFATLALASVIMLSRDRKSTRLNSSHGS